MLAPRKTLWSTPPSAIDTALSFADLQPHDVGESFTSSMPEPEASVKSNCFVSTLSNTSFTCNISVYDVGCGDGRVLIQMASRSLPLHSSNDMISPSSQKHHYCHQFIGIEISSTRAQEARDNIARAREDGTLSPHVDIEIRVANALDVKYEDATVIFLYLVPRGLRLIRPVLSKVESGGNESELNGVESNSDVQAQTKFRRIISYMNPIENEPIVKREYCKVGTVEGAAFPIYLYHL